MGRTRSAARRTTANRQDAIGREVLIGHPARQAGLDAATVQGACAGACVLTAPGVGVAPALHIDAAAAGANSGAPGECDRHHRHHTTLNTVTYF